MNEPMHLWLQFGCSDELGETWTTTRVYPEDVEYVHADEIRRALVTTDYETKEALIQRVRGILGQNPD